MTNPWSWVLLDKLTVAQVINKSKVCITVFTRTTYGTHLDSYESSHILISQHFYIYWRLNSYVRLSFPNSIFFSDPHTKILSEFLFSLIGYYRHFHNDHMRSFSREEDAAHAVTLVLQLRLVSYFRRESGLVLVRTENVCKLIKCVSWFRF